MASEMPETRKIASRSSVKTRNGWERDDLLITPVHASLDAARENLEKYFPHPQRKDLGKTPAWWFAKDEVIEVEGAYHEGYSRRTVLFQACGGVWSIEAHFTSSRATVIQAIFERFVASLDTSACH